MLLLDGACGVEIPLSLPLSLFLLSPELLVNLRLLLLLLLLLLLSHPPEMWWPLLPLLVLLVLLLPAAAHSLVAAETVGLLPGCWLAPVFLVGWDLPDVRPPVALSALG